MPDATCSRSWTRSAISWLLGDYFVNLKNDIQHVNNRTRYKEAGEALRRKQDKEREAAGLPPVQRVGARGAAQGQRGGRGGPPARGGRGAAPPARGGRGGSTGGRVVHMDKNLYVHLLGNLRKRNLLPVVVFTLSKKRCEENASTLTNQDLCTSVEKSEVHVAIEKALSRLKGTSIDETTHSLQANSPRSAG